MQVNIQTPTALSAPGTHQNLPAALNQLLSSTNRSGEKVFSLGKNLQAQQGTIEVKGDNRPYEYRIQDGKLQIKSQDVTSPNGTVTPGTWHDYVHRQSLDFSRADTYLKKPVPANTPLVITDTGTLVHLNDQSKTSPTPPDLKLVGQKNGTFNLSTINDGKEEHTNPGLTAGSVIMPQQHENANGSIGTHYYSPGNIEKVIGGPQNRSPMYVLDNKNNQYVHQKPFDALQVIGRNESGDGVEITSGGFATATPDGELIFGKKGSLIGTDGYVRASNTLFNYVKQPPATPSNAQASGCLPRLTRLFGN